MLILLFAVTLGWLPTTGMETVGARLRRASTAWSISRRHMLLPARRPSSLFYMAIYTRLMRASMLEVYGLDYVRTAQAKGLAGGKIAFKHVLRNALLPVVTMAGVQVGSLLGGSVLVETVFGWPGLGRLAFDAVFQRDFNLLLGHPAALLGRRRGRQPRRRPALRRARSADRIPVSKLLAFWRHYRRNVAAVIGLAILLVVVVMAAVGAAALSRRSLGHGRQALHLAVPELEASRSAPTGWAATWRPASSTARACRC